jgi:subfamily B ATP-binding cassette protein MsbA
MRSRVLPALLRFGRPYRWALPALAALGLVASFAEGLGIGLLIPLVDALLGNARSPPAGPFADLMQAIAAQLGENLRLVVLGIGILGLISLKVCVMWGYVGLAAWLNGRVTHDLRSALFSQLLRVRYGSIANADQGQLVNVLEAQTYRTSEALMVLSNLIGAACTILVFGLLLLLISWPLSLIVVAGVGLVSLFVRMMARRARQYGDALVRAYSDLTGHIVESLGQLRTIRVFGQEDSETARFERTSDRVRRSFARAEATAGVIAPTTELLYLPVFVLVLLIAWRFGIGLPSLLAFLVLLYRMQAPLKGLDHARVALGTYDAAVREVSGLLERTRIPETAAGRPFVALDRQVAFDRVSFSYDGQRPAVSDVSFRIGKGEVLALVGGSGAGKSTLVHLLFRLYEPDAGTIFVDDVPLVELDLGAWRRRLAFAGQDTDLFSGSVHDNIAYGRPAATAEAIERAARLAHADHFIGALPHGYDTRVGPRGLSLSGGQRQRIALARALLRDPDLLILDEATNALDGLSEQAIQETIEELRGRLTILLIAHRLSTVRLVDRVVVIMEGRVADQGRPRELLGRDGLYARLHALQLADD